MEFSGTTSTHQPRSNSTSDGSSSDDSEHEPSHPTNTCILSQNNNPILKEEEKKKKKKKKAAPEVHLLCSCFGKIVFDEHNNSSYSGGKNRLITVERHCSYSDLFHRLSKVIFRLSPYHPSVTLKYKLPNHGLDLLITVETDEDLQNMIKMYDHVNRRGHEYNPLNLRLFLVPDY